MLYIVLDNKEGTQLLFSALLDWRCVEFKHFIMVMYGTFTYSTFFPLKIIFKSVETKPLNISQP